MPRSTRYTPSITSVRCNIGTYILTLLLIGMVGIPLPLRAQQVPQTHTVKKGQTLFSIAQKYDVSVEQIKKWNNLKTNQLQPGQILQVTRPEKTKVPSKQTEEPVPEQEDTQTADQKADSYYTVKNGDTLYEIARKHNMSVQKLKKLNDLTSNAISVGQRLLVQQPTPTPSVAQKAKGRAPQGQYVSYSVQKGQDWSDILERFKMDSLELALLNPETRPNNIYGGMELTVLVPPSVTSQNPYRIDAQMQLIGTIPASRYEQSSKGTPTSSGELYNPKALTAAHPTLSLGSVIYVENRKNRRGIFVKVNDRTKDRTLRLSRKAYRVLQFTGANPRVHIFKQP